MIKKLIQEEKLTPLFFIELFQKKYKGSEYFFLNGGCKIFANILQKNFGGEILDYLGHYVTKINGLFYDVTGIIEIDESKCNRQGDCPSNDDMMDSHRNILELCLYSYLTEKGRMNEK